jgi:hypothetical protein
MTLGLNTKPAFVMGRLARGRLVWRIFWSVVLVWRIYWSVVLVWRIGRSFAFNWPKKGTQI